jgi:multiple sugar transport system permease protein
MSAPLGQLASVLSRRRSRMIARESRVGYFLATPGILALLVLFIGPTIAVFVIAATDWQLGANRFSFVGLENFRVMSVDPGFRAALLNTIVYALIVVPATIILGLVTALLVESTRTWQAFYRAVHFLPAMATMAAMAIAWEALLHPTIGLVNHAMTFLGLQPENWLRNRHTVLPALAVIGVWQNFGNAMVLFLAGLKAIPQDLYAAAAVDGADGPLDRLRTVTLPLLGPTMMFVTIIVGLRSLEVFTTVQILTKGGPDQASEVLLYTLYRESFEYLNTGYGAAITVVFLAMVCTLTLIQARTMDRRVHYT